MKTLTTTRTQYKWTDESVNKMLEEFSLESMTVYKFANQYSKVIGVKSKTIQNKLYALIENPNQKCKMSVWNIDNIEYAIKIIKDNSHNLRGAFRIIAKHLNVSIITVSKAWYDSKGVLNYYRENEPIFSTIGNNMTMNRKIVYKEQEELVKTTSQRVNAFFGWTVSYSI